MNRDHFPGLDGWARLDGPAGSLVVEDAVVAMADWMRSGDGANAHGAFAAAAATDACVDEARAAVAQLFGGVPEGVVFGPSATALTMRLAATALRDATPGDEVVCTRLDHDCNVRPWVIAAERAGATVRFADPDPDTLELPAAAVERVLSDRTRWVAVTAASNACGTIPDLPGIIALAHDAGALVHVDGVHAAPHRPLDVGALDADVLVCSAYKWFGPHVGMQVAKPEVLEALHPDKLIPSPDTAPDRFELGTLPFESLAGVTAAARYVASAGWEAVRAHEGALLTRALEGLGALDGVTLYGAAADRTPTLMFNVRGMDSATVAARLAEREIAVWDGNYYAVELERHLGLDAQGGAVRAGFLHYNTPEEADRLVEAVAELTRR